MSDRSGSSFDLGPDQIYALPASSAQARGIFWEFAGGKVKSSGMKEQALIRECWEELAVTLNVGKMFMNVVSGYPDLTVHLTLFHAVT